MPATPTDSAPHRDPVDLRTGRPHPARVYDYLLGGKNNFPADRDVVDAAAERFPTVRLAARANRAFMHRAVRYLAAEVGIRQFVDVGAGIPLSPNVHEIAQSVHPDARVVYVDNDPIVLAHARALLVGTTEGATAHLDADFLDPDRILAGVADTLDLEQPVGLLLIALLHFFGDDVDPHAVVARLVDALPTGSSLVLTHGASDVAERVSAAADAAGERGMPVYPRGHAEVTRFVAGLEVVDPGVTLVHHWRPNPGDPSVGADTDVPVYGAVARKP